MYIKTDSRITIITGHYGAGKTNFAINSALHLKSKNPAEKVAIADLDIVNPYFRTAEYKKLIEEKGIKLAVSDYARGTLDVPSVNLDIRAETAQNDRLIIDVGGDPEGARVLGRFASLIQEHDYEMIYVINHYRALTETAGQAVEIMREIENICNLKCTALFNNSHLGKETTREVIENSLPFADEVARMTALPLIELDFPIEVYVKPVWDV